MVLSILFGENGNVEKSEEPNVEVRFLKMLLELLMPFKCIKSMDLDSTDFALKHFTRLRFFLPISLRAW